MAALCYRPRVELTLQQAHADLQRAGVLQIIEDVAREVYATNADRHDPAHGDDSGTFAQLVWRNIANLAHQRLVKAGIRAKKVAGGALEVITGPWVLRIYKFPLVAPSKITAKLEQISWEGSTARLRGAVANSRPSKQLTFDETPEWATSFEAAIQQAHVRILHTGDAETGGCVIEIGLPRDNRNGGSPWLDGTIELHNDLQVTLPGPRTAASASESPNDVQNHPSPQSDDSGLPSTDDSKARPNYSDLNETPLPVKRRPEEPNEQPKSHDSKD